MKYELFQQVSLVEDVPKHNLKVGDIGTIVDHFAKGENPEEGYALEFFNALGDTIGVVILPESNISPFTEDEILAVRHRIAA
ncbi:MAG TPA: DUF4926 domain-containing protein [Candidatus Kapabacteria bacterium]|nr:DUF4926 domain-containing protein [Candidatus Kapabacteria bacterium]